MATNKLQRLNRVGNYQNLPIKKAVELVINHWYQISGIFKVTTKYGARYAVHLNDEYTVFLPPRFLKLFDSDPEYWVEIKTAVEQHSLLMRSLGGQFANLEFKMKGDPEPTSTESDSENLFDELLKMPPRSKSSKKRKAEDSTPGGKKKGYDIEETFNEAQIID